MEANETSDETRSDPSKIPVNKRDTVKEKHTQRQEERGVSQKEKQDLSSVRGDEASYYTQVVGKLVLTSGSGITQHLAKRLPTESSQKGEVETSGIGDSILNVKCAAQTLEKRNKAKPKVNVKPSVVKAVSAPKLAPKRKAVEVHSAVIAAVKPFSSSSVLQESPTKKAAVAVVPLLRINLSPCLRQKNRKTVLCCLQPKLLQNPCSQKDRALPHPRWQQNQTGRALPLPESLHSLWKMTLRNKYGKFQGGKVEAEIDLDPGKDEDDLLLELSRDY